MVVFLIYFLPEKLGSLWPSAQTRVSSALLCVSHALRWQLPIFWHLKFEFQFEPMISTTRAFLFLKRGRSVLAKQVIATHSGEADACFCG